MRIFFLLSFLIFPLFTSNSQVAIGYNNDGNTLCFSIKYPKKIWGELRVNTKAYNQATFSYKDRGVTQAYALIRLFSSENVNFYAGGGLGADLLSKYRDNWLSINIPVGLTINPIPRIPSLFFIGEYNPMIITIDENPVIHSFSLGFRINIEKNN